MIENTFFWLGMFGFLIFSGILIGYRSGDREGHLRGLEEGFRKGWEAAKLPNKHWDLGSEVTRQMRERSKDA